MEVEKEDSGFSNFSERDLCEPSGEAMYKLFVTAQLQRHEI